MPPYNFLKYAKEFRTNSYKNSPFKEEFILIIDFKKIVLITRMSQFESRCLKWCKGCKINPLRILEMGFYVRKTRNQTK